MKNARLNFTDYRPLREEIFESLRKLIVTGELKPGERLLEIQLSDKMGVSRTPVREAIRKLENEGLVTMLPRKGAHVAFITKKDLEDVLEIRGALDGLATRLATEKAKKADLLKLKEIIDDFKDNMNADVHMLIKKDVEFHDLIYKICENQKLVEISSRLREKIYRYRAKYITETKCEKKILDEHIRIFNAIKNKDAKLAQSLAEEHIMHQKEEMINLIEHK